MQIIQVNTQKLLRKFIDFPHHLYKNDPHYVPQLFVAQKQLITGKNPFFKHSEACLFLAIDNNKTVGRIAAIHNRIHNKTYNEKTGFFGFFETENNFETAKLLLDKAREWLNEKGNKKIVGPTNLTTNDSCGILIQGFDSDPVILMPYNKTYYSDFLIQYGFQKEFDLFSYYFEGIDFPGIFLEKLISKVRSRLDDDFIIRKINFKAFDDEISQMRKVYNDSNRDNQGFVSLTKEEFRLMASDLKQMVPAELIQIAEHRGKHVGFIVAVPDYNEIFKKIRKGRLFPLGIFRIILHRKRIKKARILILGLLKEYRNKGLDILMYQKISEKLRSVGIYPAEACYVMENNPVMNSVLKKIGAKHIKSYRIYSLSIPDNIP